jgi:hypothetical protein
MVKMRINPRIKTTAGNLLKRERKFRWSFMILILPKIIWDVTEVCDKAYKFQYLKSRKLSIKAISNLKKKPNG